MALRHLGGEANLIEKKELITREMHFHTFG